MAKKQYCNDDDDDDVISYIVEFWANRMKALPMGSKHCNTEKSVCTEKWTMIKNKPLWSHSISILAYELFS